MKPMVYKTSKVKDVLTLEMRQTKTGVLFYMVSFPDNDNPDLTRHASFQAMSSAIDFINTNFF